MPASTSGAQDEALGERALGAAQDLRVRVARERQTVQALTDYLLAQSQSARAVAEGARDSAFAWSVVDAEGDRAVLAFSGEIDYAVTSRFRQALTDLLDAGLVELDLDLEQITFLDSGGLSVLLAARQRAQRQGGSLRVVATSQPVLRVLRLTGLHHLLLADA